MKRLLSFLIAGVMLFGSIPAFAENQSAAGVSPSLTFGQAEVDPLIASEFKKGNKHIPIVVYMKDSLDKQQLSTQALAKGMDRHSAVVDGLKSSAFRAQQGLLQNLNEKVKQGTVEDVRSFYVANVVALDATETVVNELSKRSDVKKILFDRVIPLEVPEIVPSDPEIRTSDERIEWNISKIGADVLWEEGITGKGITVGIIDSGVDGTHPALARKWKGAGQANPSDYWIDCVAGKPLPYDELSVPHGTHVTGTILGSEADGSNQIGVAPDAQWIAAKAFNADGGSIAGLIKAGQFMLEKKPDIVNNSWGGNPGKDDFYVDVVNSWVAAGITPVFAAGNANSQVPQVPGSIGNPANYMNVLAIAATDKDDVLGNFSLLGPSPYDPTKIKPDLSAPGVNIRSSIAGGGYQSGWNGTSMATPHIAGVLALMKQVHNAEPNLFYEDILRNTAIPRTDDMFRQSPNMGYGYGVVDAYAAVHSAQQGQVGVIQGRVLAGSATPGETAISHEQLLKVGFTSSDLDLTAAVKDTVSVTKVKAVVTQGETVKEYEMKDISGDEKSGEYQILVPAEDLKEASLTYRFEATNFNGVVTKSPDYTMDIKFGMKAGYFENFEADPVGWFWDGDWELGTPAKGPGKAFSGENALATKLKDKYTGPANSTIITPPLDLRELDTAYLTFQHWIDTPTVLDYDHGRVFVTTDLGETWTQLEKTWKGQSTDWTEAGVNLSDYAGSETPVFVALDFFSDYGDQGDGWFIDDFSFKTSQGEVPSDVTGLKLEEATINYIKLAWDPVADVTLDHYRVERLNEWSGEYDVIAKVNATDYRDASIYSNKTYEYRVSAVDFSGKASAVPAKLTVDSLKSDEFFKAKFSNTWNTYFKTGGINSCWQYGEVEWNELDENAPSKPYNSNYVWGTNLTGDYRKRSDSYIQNETAFAIPAEGHAYLNFTHWYEIEDGNPAEYGVVQISVDGGETWTDLSEKYAGEKKVWSDVEISLDKYRGESNVLLRFTLLSDDLFQYPGWYISGVTAYSLPEAVEPLKEAEPVKEAAAPEKEEAEKKLPTQSLKLQSVQTAGIAPAVETAEPAAQAPVGATIRVVETGRYATSSARTGEYRLFHKVADQITLRAEAYGFEAQSLKFSLAADETKTVDFHLEPKATNKVTGVILDETSKKPIANAKVRVREDVRVAEVVTDANGRFELPRIYVGSYTLVVSHPDYLEGEKTVHVLADSATSAAVELKRFVGYEVVQSWDDGSGENFLVLGKNAGNVVLFEPGEFVKVKAIDVFFGKEGWPVPGGTSSSVAILRMNEDGTPIGFAAAPKPVEVKRGEWNTFDLSDMDFSTSGIFGLAVIQTTASEYSPAMALDTGGTDFVPQERSYVYSGGGLTPLSQLGVVGNMMIRARYAKSLENITLDNLNEVHYVNTRELPVSGSVQGDCSVNLYLDGRLAATVQTADRKFNTTLTLTGDRHELTATAMKDQKETTPTKPVTVIFDNAKPELNVTLPWDQTVQADRFLETTGKVFDANFDHLTIQGEPVEVESTGAFRHELILNNGSNVVVYQAVDKAGNVTEVRRNVEVKPVVQPTFEVLSPLADTKVVAGDVVNLQAKAAKGTVSFQVSLSDVPDAAAWKSMTAADGVFTAQWTAPAIGLGSYYVHFRHQDGSVDKSYMAPGKIMVGTASVTQRIAGANRYATAAEVARMFGTSEKVYLVSGEKFADSVVAGPLARQNKAPLLLTKPEALTPETASALSFLKAKEVVIVGGELAVKPEVEASLKALGLTVTRIAGATRYETSALVAASMKQDGRFLVASGESLADAMAAGSYGLPILLSPAKTLDPKVAAVLDGAAEVTLLGGEKVLDAALPAQIKAGKVNRLAGTTRYETNVEILKHFAGTPEQVVLANGTSLADALTSAPLGLPVLLSTDKALPAAAKTYLEASTVRQVLILGGHLVISTELETTIQSLLKN